MIAVLFIILVLCLFIGVPVGFSIGISAMSFLAVSQFTPVTIMAQRLVDGLNSFPSRCWHCRFLSWRVKLCPMDVHRD